MRSHTCTHLYTEGHIQETSITKRDKALLAWGRQRIVWWWSTRAIPHLEQHIKHAFKELAIKCEAWELERWILLDRLYPGLSSSKLLGGTGQRRPQRSKSKFISLWCGMAGGKKTNYTEEGVREKIEREDDRTNVVQKKSDLSFRSF